MFSDRPASKIKKILVPFLIWIAMGAAAEILGVIAVLFFRKNGAVDVSPDLFSLLETAHERYEYPMLICRDLASLPFMIRYFRADTARINVTLPEVAAYIERVRFFNGSRMRGKRSRYLLFLLPGVFYAISANLLLYFLGKAEPAVTVSSAVTMLLILFFSVIAAPALEELLCRGLIYRRLRTYTGVLPALLLSALFFALFHLNPVRSIYAFFLGLVLADLYEISGSLPAVILTHAAANAASLLITYLPSLNGFIITNGIPVFIIVTVLLPASIVFIGLTAGKEE